MPDKFGEHDPSFFPSIAQLQIGLDLLLTNKTNSQDFCLLNEMPKVGMGEVKTLQLLAPQVLSKAADLKTKLAMAHMDPPTPWITWLTTMWNASLNQNLLHPSLSPVATEIETIVIKWLAPYFGMSGGHITPGSTISNLTALWAARDLKGINQVVASGDAHLSVAKAAHILGVNYVSIPTNTSGQIDIDQLPNDLSRSALVLTAGTTSAGAIDPLEFDYNAGWLHIDAAWAGPLVFSERYNQRLSGVENADSICFSAHKWLFQPKDSGVILFKDCQAANKALSFGGDYLAVPNVGLMGSRSAAAIPLYATLLSWGASGLAKRINQSMANADKLWASLNGHSSVHVFSANHSGVVLWRPNKPADVSEIYSRLPDGLASKTQVNNQQWIRHVAANPNADIELITNIILDVISS